MGHGKSSSGQLNRASKAAMKTVEDAFFMKSAQPVKIIVKKKPEAQSK